MSWICTCGHRNGERSPDCGECGSSQPKAVTSGKAARCSTCAAPLLASGRCSDTGDFPAGMTCPFSCGICRQPLSWEGACFSCHGTVTGRREDWTMPGDRYELIADHWHKVLAGPRRACTVEENRVASGLIRSVLNRRMPVDQAETKMAELFGADWPGDSAG